jgi:hypothetical protein
MLLLLHLMLLMVVIPPIHIIQGRAGLEGRGGVARATATAAADKQQRLGGGQRRLNVVGGVGTAFLTLLLVQAVEKVALLVLHCREQKAAPRARKQL